ncbi:hypothetical protein TSOC_000674, partial [Tetrabaena socialis]
THYRDLGLSLDGELWSSSPVYQRRRILGSWRSMGGGPPDERYGLLREGPAAAPGGHYGQHAPAMPPWHVHQQQLAPQQPPDARSYPPPDLLAPRGNNAPNGGQHHQHHSEQHQHHSDRAAAPRGGGRERSRSRDRSRQYDRNRTRDVELGSQRDGGRWGDDDREPPQSDYDYRDSR